MAIQRQSHNRHNTHFSQGILYRTVFGSTLSSLIVACLVASILLQPLRVSASEDAVLQTPVQVTDELIARVEQLDTKPLPPEVVSTVTEELEPASAEASEPALEPAPVTISSLEAAPGATTPPEQTSVSESDSEPASASASVTSTVPVPDGTTDEPNIITLPATSTVETPTENTAAETAQANASTTDIQASTTDETATSSEISVALLTVESDQMIQFEKNDCVIVEDGSYYCQPTKAVEKSFDDGLFALPDADGDLEIFLKREGEFLQITFNQTDDASPVYDDASDSIVWHRLVDERYQIISYDVATGEEQQLTDTDSNNMEASRFDNYTVWQHWSNDAWQVMLFDGKNLQQLTNTKDHNIAPTIRNGLVVWHRVLGGGEQSIEVYDLESGSYMTISDDSGGSVSNPRMVLVFESTLPSGDIVTKGYDLVTGEVTDFEQTPAALPEELPEPDSTGETRALISSKTTTEEETDNVLSNESASSSGPVPPPQTDIATSTVDIATTTLTLDLSTPATTSVEVIDTVFDVVVLPFVASSSGTTTSE